MREEKIVALISDILELTEEESSELNKKMRDLEILKKFTWPNHPSSDGYYHLNIKNETQKGGRKQLKAKTIEQLQEKVLIAIKKPSFEEIFQKREAHYGATYKTEEDRIRRNNSVRKHFSTYGRFFEEQPWTQKPIEQVKQVDLRHFLRDQLLKFDLRKKSYQSLCQLITATFKFAVNEELLSPEKNFVSHFDFNDNEFTDLLVDDAPLEDGMHSEEERLIIQQACLERIRKNPDNWTAWYLLFQTEMAFRTGETTQKFSDIRPNKKHPEIMELVISSSLLEEKGTYSGKMKFHEGKTKTKKERAYQLPEGWLKLVDSLKEAHENCGLTTDYMFPGVTQKAVYSLYRRICREKGIVIDKDHPKEPRSFRRNLAELIDDHKYSSSLLGHSESVDKKNYYDGIDAEKSMAVLDKVLKKREEIAGTIDW